MEADTGTGGGIEFVWRPILGQVVVLNLYGGRYWDRWCNCFYIEADTGTGGVIAFAWRPILAQWWSGGMMKNLGLNEDRLES